MTKRSFIEKCEWCRELWDAATPWVQIIGFIILCAFTVGTSWAKFNTLESTTQSLVDITDKSRDRIGVLENQYGRIDQKLDDISDYLGVRKHK